ncbi:MAG: hypothetical protein AB7N65_10615 [Vicinamibacterales bacterium]
MSFDETLHTTLDALRRTVDEVLTREVTHVQESIRTAVDHERRTVLEHSAQTAHGAVRIPVPAFAELPLARKAIAVPIVIHGRVMAVLYADQGRQPAAADHPAEGATWPASLEVMTRVASRCLEASGVLRAASSSTTVRTADVAPVAAGGRR